MNLDEIAGNDPKRRERIRKAERAAKPNGHPPERSLIRLRGGGLAEHVADAERALAAATLAAPLTGVYARGSLLVRPVRLRDARDSGGICQAARTLQLLPVDPDYLRLELTRLVHFEKFDKRSDAWADVDAPKDLAASLLAAAPWTALPKLGGIIEAPTLRHDGSLLDRPGYDQATGLLFDPGGARFPDIAPRPSRRDAEAALATLLEIIEDFPFADEASRSVAVAAFITGLVRRALRAAPLIAYTAPKMASGKTLLATCVAYLATGRAPAMVSQSDDAESERKRFLALLLEGSPIIVLDNVDRPLASASLCSILTEPLFADRVLGVSRTASVPTNATFLTTGNNITLAGDLSTRALVAALDPICEKPEERRFAVNLHDAVPARRGEFVAAALTIPLAYLAAGAPTQEAAPFGRFEDWARWCRNPLLWLAMADPCASRERIESRDPVRENLRALLTSWDGAFGPSAQSVASAAALQSDGNSCVALRAAIEAVAQQGREINLRRLGNFISKHEGRIEGGLRFTRAGDRQGVALWQVTP